MTSKELADTSLAISAFGEDQQGEVYVADQVGDSVYRIKDSSCTLEVEAAYSANTLSLDFDLGAAAAGTWSVTLVSTQGAAPLWSAPIPALDPPIERSFDLPLSPSGVVAALTVIRSSQGAPLCVDVARVDTGGQGAAPEAINALLEELTAQELGAE